MKSKDQMKITLTNVFGLYGKKYPEVQKYMVNRVIKEFNRIINAVKDNCEISLPIYQDPENEDQITFKKGDNWVNLTNLKNPKGQDYVTVDLSEETLERVWISGSFLPYHEVAVYLEYVTPLKCLIRLEW